jgi:methylated-DNA-[protein]-cysteine S-methyltransferase
MNSLTSTTIDTPTGPLTIVATGAGAVRAAGFTAAAADLLAPGAPAPAPRADLGPITAAVRAYLAGDLTAIDAVPVEQPGTGFQRAAWRALRESKPGDPLTYSELALRAGRPAAVRAAGQACARNQVMLFVPCHRVVPAGGGPGGYRWGADRKRWLLDHEQR